MCPILLTYNQRKTNGPGFGKQRKPFLYEEDKAWKDSKGCLGTHGKLPRDYVTCEVVSKGKFHLG